MSSIFSGPGQSLIEAYTFDGSTPGKNFSNIPQGFSRLQLIGRLRSTRAAQATGELLVTLNGDTTAANYVSLALLGIDPSPVGAFVSADAGFKLLCPAATAPANAVSAPLVDIAGYTDAFHKTVDYEYLLRNGTAAANHVSYLRKGIWLNTAAITSLTVTDSFANPVAGSTLRLYGLI